MEKALVDYIMAQRAEAEAFTAAAPGNFMGMMPHPDEFVYWSSRVPSGTLKELKRIELEEDAYYITADKCSKSYARSLEFHNWSDANLKRHIERMCA